MKKGIVVDRNDDYVTLLTPDGQFLKANKQKRSYELGEEITFFQLSDTSERAKPLSIFNLRGIRTGLLAGMALILLFFTVLPVFKDDKVYAYMTIDINPSFELRLNEKLQVVQIEPMNEDGKKMLDDIKGWKNREISDVFSKIVDKSKDLGYLKGEKEIFITTVTTDDKHESVKKKMRADVDQLKDSYKNENVKVSAVESDVETRNKAADQGISTGKYMQLNAETAPLNENKGEKEEGKQETPSHADEENSKKTPPAVKPPAEEKEKQAPPEIPAKKEELKETIPEKKKITPLPPKDKVSIKKNNKEAEKAKKEAKKKRRKEEKGKWQREEDIDDDDRRHRDNDQYIKDRDRDDDDEDNDEGSRFDRD
ncbi:anti-sigma factor domain-containing protein [Bacillus sp. F19]|nr:anti-sigma factor domain-containing protein [Bacillus sp. F19]